MTDLPDPLVPVEVDLRDFQYMELDVRRLRDSRFGAEVSGDAFRAGVFLWCASWHQVPAGSVPDDDVELANLAGYGRFVKEWRKARDEALHGFVRCSDGRWYHPTVCEKAAQAWESKLRHHYDRARDRLRKANKARVAQGLAELPELSFESWNAQRLGSGVPMEKADASAGIPQNAPPEKFGIPAENALRGNREGTERERNGEGDSLSPNTAELRSAVDDGHAAADRPALVLVEPTPELPDCPHQELIDLYRKHLPHLRQPARWDGDRAEAMRMRWRECAKPTSFGDGYRTKAEGLAFWDRFFAFVAATPKLRDGITSRDNGQLRVWKPDLPWLVTKGNFLKVIEGAYE